MRTACVAAALVLGAAAPAVAGPPYITDDPVPTDPGHWEIYAFTAVEGRRATFDGDTGLDLNYGPRRDLQLTATLPVSFSHERGSGWSAGRGDVELGAKYRFVHDESHGFSASIFPRVILPTAAQTVRGRTRLLLPAWLGKDFAHGTSIFGGGGYLINPGAGNRSYWQAAVAVTQDLSKRVSVGGEVTRQGADLAGGTAQTRAGLGAVVHLAGPASLLMSGGRTWADHQPGYHFYTALGFAF